MSIHQRYISSLSLLVSLASYLSPSRLRLASFGVVSSLVVSHLVSPIFLRPLPTSLLVVDPLFVSCNHSRRFRSFR